MECCPDRETTDQSPHEVDCDHREGAIGLPGKGEGSFEELVPDGQMGSTMWMNGTGRGLQVE